VIAKSRAHLHSGAIPATVIRNPGVGRWSYSDPDFEIEQNDGQGLSIRLPLTCFSPFRLLKAAG